MVLFILVCFISKHNNARGNKSGGLNLTNLPAGVSPDVAPEKVDAFELGFKSQFLDRRVQLNLAGFYYDYSNQQTTQVVGATTFTRSANGRVFLVHASFGLYRTVIEARERHKTLIGRHRLVAAIPVKKGTQRWIPRFMRAWAVCGSR